METQISDMRLMSDLFHKGGFDLNKLKNIYLFQFSQSKPIVECKIIPVQEAFESDESKK